MHRTPINPNPCPHCGDKLEFRATVGKCEQGDVHFFQCKGCGYIDTRDDNERSVAG